jgi:hypothetical protein
VTVSLTESGLRKKAGSMFLVCALFRIEENLPRSPCQPLMDAEPVTATKISSVANCSREDIQRAIKSAAVAQKEYYRSTTGAQRGVLLRKWYDFIVANVDDCEFMGAPCIVETTVS